MRLKTVGGEIEYDVRGDGPGVLLLHAFPLGLAMWDEQVEALSATHRVVRFDARGFGRSPHGDGILTMERIADDAAAVLDAADVAQAIVCGLSMGGYAAFAFARRYPERLKGLVLADTRPQADSAEARQNRSAQADKVRREGAAAIAEAMLPKLLGRTTHEGRPQVVARVRDVILQTDPRGILDGLAGLAARADSTPTLRQIRVPTLVVVGEEDAITPPADAEAMQKGITGATRLARIPAAGHLSNLENPTVFNQALSSFLAGLP
jgi:3-oxoadipate enol-lactonase